MYLFLNQQIESQLLSLDGLTSELREYVQSLELFIQKIILEVLRVIPAGNITSLNCWTSGYCTSAEGLFTDENRIKLEEICE